MFEVWSPKAQSMQVEVGGQRHSMNRARHGWWTLSLPQTTGEVDYSFCVDGGQPLPDPRSPWQPQGVHANSRRLDHSRFRWTDQEFQAPPLAAAVIYEVHIGTFTPQSTFVAAIEHLDHLVDLGITHVELMPVASWDGPRGWGYDGVSLFAPHEAYGGPEGLMKLVNACHERGLAVLLDVVYNHLGPSGNYLSQFGNYFTSRHHTAWGEAVNFDGPGSDEVRRLVLDNISLWLRDYHIDGLRLDAVHAIVDTSATHVLEAIADRVRLLEAETGRHLVVIAESDLNDPRLVRPREAGGFGLDAHWADDIHHTLHTSLTGELTGYYEDFGDIAQLAASLQSPYVYAGHYSEFRGRTHGRQPIGLAGRHFVTCIQNHDQVGNRALGERLSHLVSIERAKLGAGLLLTSAYVPLLFQGEEWAASTPFQFFTSFPDTELGNAVTVGRRKECESIGWPPEQVPDPQNVATFERSKLAWGEMARPPHADMLAWYKQLIALRKNTPWLSDGQLEAVHAQYSQPDRWIRVHRGPGTIVANLSDRTATVPLEPDRSRQVLMASCKSVEFDGPSLSVPPDGFVVLGPDGPLPLSQQSSSARWRK